MFEILPSNLYKKELAFEQSGAVLQETPKSFKVDCTWYRPSPSLATQINNAYLLHHSYFPDSSFILTQNVQGNPQRFSADQPKATADKGFDLILSKFTSTGLVSESAKFEVTGNEYSLRDFMLRVGSASYSTKASFKGVIVEFEYSPSNIVTQCSALLQEMVEFFFKSAIQSGFQLRKPEVFTRHSQADNYMPIDTISQYLDIFLAMQKRN